MLGRSIAPRATKLAVAIGVGFVVLALAIALLPYIFYGLNAAGFKLAEAKAGAVRVDMARPWIPIAASDSLLGPYLLGNASPPSLMYYRFDWFSPWTPDFVVFTQLPQGTAASPSLTTNKEQFRFDWGTVVLVYGSPHPGKGSRYLVAPDKDIGITAGDLSWLREIRRLEKLTSPSNPEIKERNGG